MPTPRLPDPFDGLPVVKVAVKLTNAGDGFSQAVATDALTFHHGERVTLVMDAVVVGTNIRPLDKDDLAGPQQAQYVLSGTGRATFADPADLRTLLDAQEKRNDEARGRPQLPLAGGESPDGIPAELDPADDPSVPSQGFGPPSDDLPVDGDGYADPELENVSSISKPRKAAAKKATGAKAK